jgi:hypothetical protein
MSTMGMNLSELHPCQTRRRSAFGSRVTTLPLLLVFLTFRKDKPVDRLFQCDADFIVGAGPQKARVTEDAGDPQTVDA